MARAYFAKGTWCMIPFFTLHRRQQIMILFTITPVAFQAEGYCRCMRLSVCTWSLPCPYDNSSHIWATITKFAPNMHPGLLSSGIENMAHWPWPSRSFWLILLRILGNSACPRNNSSQIWAEIAKFASNMHLGMLLSGIENKGHWPWPARSFWPFWPRILGHLTCPDDNSSQIWAKITKLTRNMLPWILPTGIENRGH